MPELIPVLMSDEIEEKVAAAAETISSDYREGQLVLIGVLKGAFIFLADLIRHLTIPVQIDFVRAASYGSGTCSSGEVRFHQAVEIDVEGKDILIVEDIVDTGLTLGYLKDHLETRGARSIKVCAFLDKRERRKAEIAIDYACHVVESGFLVGYGLDYAENYRHLPGIFHLKL